MNLIKTLLLIFNVKMMREIAGNNCESRNNGKRLKDFIVSVDNTICNTPGNNYEKATPILENIEFFNELHEKGHKIHYWTSRGMISNKNWDLFTIEQLKCWNVKYTSLNMNKPCYDYWIDDKAVNIKDI
jgi:hypothetical protein